MITFTITEDNNVTAFGSDVVVGANEAKFTSADSLLKVSAGWPMTRLVDIWNGITGVSPVKKFENRVKATARIWVALQPLAANVAVPEKAAGKATPSWAKAAKAAKPAKVGEVLGGRAVILPAAAAGYVVDRDNKKSLVIAMMERADGATLGEIGHATGWQKHTIRAFVSVLGSKQGRKIESTKSAAGERTYRIVVT